MQEFKDIEELRFVENSHSNFICWLRKERHVCAVVHGENFAIPQDVAGRENDFTGQEMIEQLREKGYHLTADVIEKAILEKANEEKG